MIQGKNFGKKKLYRLKDPVVGEVSLVKAAATGKRFMFIKNGEKVNKDISLLADGTLDGAAIQVGDYLLHFTKQMKHSSTIDPEEPKWEQVNESKLPISAFAYVGDAEDRSTWKYPHHFVKNGTEDENGVYSNGELYLHKGKTIALANSFEKSEGIEEETKADVFKHMMDLGISVQQDATDADVSTIKGFAKRIESVDVDKESATKIAKSVKTLVNYKELMPFEAQEALEDLVTDAVTANKMNQFAKGESMSEANENEVKIDEQMLQNVVTEVASQLKEQEDSEKEAEEAEKKRKEEIKALIAEEVKAAMESAEEDEPDDDEEDEEIEDEEDDDEEDEDEEDEEDEDDELVEVDYQELMEEAKEKVLHGNE